MMKTMPKSTPYEAFLQRLPDGFTRQVYQPGSHKLFHPGTGAPWMCTQMNLPLRCTQ